MWSLLPGWGWGLRVGVGVGRSPKKLTFEPRPGADCDPMFQAEKTLVLEPPCPSSLRDVK